MPVASEPAVASSPTTTDTVIRIAVTFDDLPEHGPIQSGTTRLDLHRQLLDVLDRHRVPEVYGFVNANGAQVPDGRAALELWRDRGHRLGNHTWSHPDLGEVGAAAFITEIDRNDAFLAELLGPAGDPAARRVFRYPYLRQGRDAETVDLVRRHLASQGYRIAEVTIDFSDWAYNPPFVRCTEQQHQDGVQALQRAFLQSADAHLRWSKDAAHALFGRDIAHVLLLHLGSIDAAMLDAMLTSYEEAGAVWITLDEALADPAYARDIRLPAKYWGTWLHKTIAVDGTAVPPAPVEVEMLAQQLCR